MLQPGCTASLASNQAAYPSVLCSSCRYHTKPSVRGNSSRRDTLAAGLAVLPAIDNLWQPLPASAAVAAPPKPFCGVVDRVPSWAYNTPWQEDIIDFAGGKTWYRYVNYVPPAGSGGIFASLQRRYSPTAPDKLPLLVVSGGPGLASSYLEPLELMAGVGRQVVFYDQVGCGNTFLASNSTCLPPEQLTPELYLQQIDALRAALKLERCHLYGQGIGGMLALSYAATRGGKAAGIVSVNVGSVAPSYSQLAQDRQAAAQQLLGSNAASELFASDAAGAGSSTAAAFQQYRQQYVCRLPAATAATGCVARVQQQQSQPVYAALAGGRYFDAAGSLAGWSVSELDGTALQDTPVLITRGQFDEVTQASAQQLADALPSSQGKVYTFDGSGSYMHIDAWEPHLTRVEVHLCEAEGSEPPTTTP